MTTEKDTSKRVAVLSYSLLASFAVLSIIATYFLFGITRSILEQRLKERIKAVVSTASLQFSLSDIYDAQVEEDYKKESYKRMVHQLQGIRNVNNNVFFAYLLRPTEDPTIYHFIADADSINPYAEIDLNSDGVMDEEDELAYPGLEYDVSHNATLVGVAKEYTSTDEAPIVDPWGTFLSAYTPIKDKGKTVAVLGIDVEVTDYLILINQTFKPFAIFVVFIFGILTVLTLSLVKIWNSRVELLKELDRQKDELLGMVSHQLAAPVTSMKWYLELLMDGDMGKLEPDQKETITSMQDIASNLADLVGMILDVSRIQLGRMKMSPQPLDLAHFFKEILDVISPKAKEKQINFSVSLPEGLPTVLLDKRYTRMTVENLLTNAIKYTPEKGNVNWTVKCDANEIYCEVKDTGYGIPKQDQGKIFGKLYRASNVRNTVDGNGFGLYIAKGAIESQGGKIWFESEEGKGTTFFIKLPIKKADPSTKAA